MGAGRNLLIRILLIVLAATVVAAGPARAITPERKLYHFINDARTEHGLHTLSFGRRLSLYADDHALRMARAGYIFHSDLSFPKPSGWRRAGENVGVGGSIWSLHRAFMRSPSHRRNVLTSLYQRVGVGVVERDDRLWVAVEFVG